MVDESVTDWVNLQHILLLEQGTDVNSNYSPLSWRQYQRKICQIPLHTTCSQQTDTVGDKLWNILQLKNQMFPSGVGGD